MPKSNKSQKGFTLIEMLVVTGLFAGLAVLVGTMVATSFRSTKKGERAVKVRAELENAIAVVERSLRGAKRGSVVTCTNTNIAFTDQDDLSVSLSCSGASLKMGSNDLVGPNVNLTTCNFDCSRLSEGVIVVTIGGVAEGLVGVESDSVTVAARVLLRNY